MTDLASSGRTRRGRTSKGGRKALLAWALFAAVVAASGLVGGLAVSGGAPTPGRAFRDCAECPEMVVIPGGEFIMGSERDDASRSDEAPTRRVRVAAFAAGKFEVTQAEWTACVRAGACAPQRAGARSGFLSNRPAHAVSWREARQYVAWLSRRTRHEYRLLSEAEWEYAARARRGAHAAATRFSWGDQDPMCEPDAEAGAAFGSGASALQHWCLGHLAWPVGSFPANAFGLYDMHGNASEWVEDCWHDDYAGGPVDGSAWIADGDCRLRVQRGGAWSSPAERLRSAARSAARADDPSAGGEGHGGLRVARALR